jgi:hypothetical protein
MNTSKICLAIMFLSLAIMTGCGGPDPNLGKVSGTVTYKGAPVEGATVSFLPANPGSGVLAVATTDAAGHYVLAAPQTDGGVAAGAFSGSYNVTIRKMEVTLDPNLVLFNEGKIDYDELQERGGGTGGGTTRDLLPAKYRDVKSSGLKAEVQAQAENVCDFVLE